MMVVSRKTGELIYAEPLTEEQRKAAALAVFKAFCKMNPEIIRQEVEKALNETD